MKRLYVRQGCAVAALMLGLVVSASASEPPSSPSCARDGVICAPASKTPLGISQRVLVYVLDSSYGGDRQARIDELKKQLQASSSDQVSSSDIAIRLELLAIGGDDRDAREIDAFLTATIAKADAAQDHAVAAIARLLSAQRVDADADDGDKQVDTLVAAALRDARAVRAGKKPTPRAADMADLLAALIDRFASYVLDDDADNRDRNVSAMQKPVLEEAIKALKSRLDRSPRDVARLSFLGEVTQMAVTGDADRRGLADELVTLRERWVGLAPGDGAARAALVTAYQLRGDTAIGGHDFAAAQADAASLDRLAATALQAHDVDSVAARAFYLGYLLKARAQGEDKPVASAQILIEGFTRLKQLAPANPALQHVGTNLGWPLVAAIDRMLKTHDTAAAAQTERRALASIDDPAFAIRLRVSIADAYASNDLSAEAALRYRGIMQDMIVQPLDANSSSQFFKLVDSLLEVGKAGGAASDASVLVESVLVFVSEERVAAFTRADGDADEVASELSRMAGQLHDLSDKFDKRGADDQMIPLLQREIALREPIATDAKRRADAVDDLAIAYRDLAKALSALDRDTEAVVFTQKRVDIRREQAGKRPFASLELKNYVWALRDLGDEQRYTDEDAASLESYKEGDRVAAALLKRFPGQSSSYEVSAAIATAMGNAATSTLFKLIYHKKAEAMNLAQIKQLGEKNFDYDFLAVSQVNIGDDYLDSKKYELALTYLEKALAANDTTLKDDAGDFSLLRRRVLITDKMIKAQRALGRLDPAIETLRLRIAAFEKMAEIKGTPDKDLPDAYRDLAELLQQTGGAQDEIADILRKAAAL